MSHISVKKTVKDFKPDLCDALDQKGYKMTWGFQTRIGALSKADMERAYASGCRWIDFGIESGSPQMIKRIGKNIPLDKIPPTFEWCKEAGIISMSNFIVGLPHETPDDLRHSVNLVRSLPGNEPTFLLYGYNYGSPVGKEIYGSGKYKLPKKLKDYSKIDFCYNRLPNFSETPDWDKKVVQGYFLWNQLFKKDYSEETKSFDLIYKYLKIVFERISYVGILHLPEALVKSAFPFVRFFIAAKFCKKNPCKIRARLIQGDIYETPEFQTHKARLLFGLFHNVIHFQPASPAVCGSSGYVRHILYVTWHSRAHKFLHTASG